MTNRFILALLCSLLAFAGWTTSASAEAWIPVEPLTYGPNCVRFFVYGSTDWWTPGWKPNQFRVYESQPDDWREFAQEMKCRSALVQFSLDKRQLDEPKLAFLDCHENTGPSTFGLRLARPFDYVSAANLHWSYLPCTLLTKCKYQGAACESKIEYQVKLANLETAAWSKDGGESSAGRGDVARESIESVPIVSCLLWYPAAASVNEPLKTPDGTQFLVALAAREEVHRSVSIEDLATRTEREARYLKQTPFTISLMIYR